MKKQYGIKIRGCDDSTYFNFELSEQEYELLKSIAKKSVEVSESGCMPTIIIFDKPHRVCEYCGKMLREYEDECYNYECQLKLEKIKGDIK